MFCSRKGKQKPAKFGSEFYPDGFQRTWVVDVEIIFVLD